MDEKERLLDEIVVIEKRIKDLDREIYLKMRRLSELSCPYKIGQLMECKKKIGWSKVITRRARINKIVPHSYEPYYELFGTYILKSGLEGKQHELYSYEDWEPIKSEEVTV